MKNIKLGEVGEIIDLAPPGAKKRQRLKRANTEAYYREHYKEPGRRFAKTQILLDMIARDELPRHLIRERKITDQQVRTASIERLVEEVFMCVEHLNNITKSHPDLVIPIARRLIVWPGFISRKSAFQKKNAKLMARIELGNDYALTGEWQPDSSSTRGAHWLYSWGIGMAKEWRLPKLTRKNKRSWFDKVWQCLIKKLHIIPEQDPLLGPLGKSAKRDYKREDSKERTPRAVRAEIKRQIWKAFDKLILRNN